jgi:hypothetical protein
MCKSIKNKIAFQASKSIKNQNQFIIQMKNFQASNRIENKYAIFKNRQNLKQTFNEQKK